MHRHVGGLRWRRRGKSFAGEDLVVFDDRGFESDRRAVHYQTRESTLPMRESTSPRRE